MIGVLVLGCSGVEELPISGVLITIDTTNAPALDFYGKDRGLTPNLSRLAQSGLVYDRAYTSAPITLPAHASMMTGLYPIRHGVRENGLMQLSSKAQTLAERAQEAGFETAAFVSAVVLSKTYGLDQGFETYQGPAQGKGRPSAAIAERHSGEVTDAAIAWLEGRQPKRPFFLWVHYYDPHAPYDPPQKFVERAKGNLYLGEVAAMDEDIGRLIDTLEEEIGMDGMLLAVVADHGESHNRHGEPTHAAYCYDATVRVPLVLHYPDSRSAGERSPDVVSVVDLFPTFLEVLGLGSAGDVDGLSLASGSLPEGRGVYVESYYGYFNLGWSPLAGWVDANGKYLHSSTPEFYDLVADPKEATNLLIGGSPDTEAYRRSIEELSNRPRLAFGGGVELDLAEVEQLRGLGYAAVGSLTEEALPDPLDPSELMAPAAGAATYAEFVKAAGLVGQNDLEPAMKILRAILKQNPNHTYALETLGGALLERREYAEAIELLERVLITQPGRYPTRIFLAVANEALGNYAATLKHYRAAQVIRPGEKGLPAEIARVEELLSDE